MDDDGTGVFPYLILPLSFVVAEEGCYRAAGDVLEHRVGVLDGVHHNGHYRRFRPAQVPPFLHFLLVVPVEGIQGLFQQGVVSGHVGAEVPGLLRVCVAEYIPEFRFVRPVGRCGHPGDLGEPGLDGVDERVVGDYPVKGPGVGLCQEDWRSRHVDDVAKQSGVSYLLDALEPLGVLRQGVFLVGVSPVAVMALIVDD